MKAKIIGLRDKEEKTRKRKGMNGAIEEADELFGGKEEENEVLAEPKKGNEKYEDISFIPFGKDWDSTKV